MLFKKSNVSTAKLDAPNTVIGSGIYLEAARITGSESVRIDGIYKGTIELDGPLVLGDSGSITGDVRANYFLVAGEVAGNINCTSQLRFASTSKVIGDVQAASLIVDEGAQVSGKYTVGDSSSSSITTPAISDSKYEERLRFLAGEDDSSAQD